MGAYPAPGICNRPGEVIIQNNPVILLKIVGYRAGAAEGVKQSEAVLQQALFPQQPLNIR